MGAPPGHQCSDHHPRDLSFTYLYLVPHIFFFFLERYPLLFYMDNFITVHMLAYGCLRRFQYLIPTILHGMAGMYTSNIFLTYHGMAVVWPLGLVRFFHTPKTPGQTVLILWTL